MKRHGLAEGSGKTGASYETNAESKNESKNESGIEEDFGAKTSGIIFLGPIPIIFGNGSGKTVFKYALAFFMFILIILLLFSRIVRL
ncbi:MAG: DUF131 domain-containing protein [Methanosarcinales archaeon]|jgi:uncharacterized protein (TIGR00304 family)|nr:DUF131 domain-containing protein [Methanosarcinales archaeon]